MSEKYSHDEGERERQGERGREKEREGERGREKERERGRR